MFLQRLLKGFFSSKFSGFLLLAFAVSMAVATFVENDYSTETAKTLIYNAKWFEILLLLLAISFAGNIAKYNLFSLKKAPIFVFHFAFIIIILGAGVTKYRGSEGLMTIKEGEVSNQIVSLESYVQLRLLSDIHHHNFISKKLQLSELGRNQFRTTFTTSKEKIKVRLIDYIPRAAYKIEPSDQGAEHVHIAIANNQERSDFYIKKGTRETIYGIPISFDSADYQSGDVLIKEVDSSYKIMFPETTSYFNMIENRASVYPKDSLVDLQFKSLSEFGGVSFVINTVIDNVEKQLVSQARDFERKNPESAIVLEVSNGTDKKEITLFGGRGYINPFSTLTVNGKQLEVRYGSKPKQLPFSLQLDNFILERYPGSQSPSAFYSNIKVIETNNTFKYNIFMNNVLNHKGYRFFQSAYTPDEKGTILSVNRDYWGTRITYLGYSLLALGMFMSLFWKSSHFNQLLHQMN